MRPIRKTNWGSCLLALLLMLFLLSQHSSVAQSVGISSSSITPDASSILELRTSTKGILLPRMTATERDAIASPATGLMIYNTSTGKFNYYNGSAWVSFFSGTAGVNSVTGTSNRISIGGTAADPAVDIASNYAGQNSINTLGTISTGTWNGSTIGIGYGGTGATTQQAAINALTGTQTNGYYLRSNGTNAVLSAIQAGDVPLLNQNTTGSAATLTTSRLIHGGSFNGSADVINIIASTYGGTGNGFTRFSGPATSEKTFTLPNANATILTDNATVTAVQGGTGQASYTTGDILYASSSTALSRLAGVATGNALLSGGVGTAPSWGKIGLTTHISGTLPVANGGTNSSAALNNNRIMVSSGGAITEASALSNGQLLIGSSGSAPVAANLTAGDGIAITNGAGSITIKNEPVIFQATSTTTATTTSLTDVLLTDMSITPGAGDYLVFFTGSVKNTNDNKQGSMSIYSNGVKIAASEVHTRAPKESYIPVALNAYITGLGNGQAIEVRWNVLANISSCYQRTLIVQRVK